MDHCSGDGGNGNDNQFETIVEWLIVSKRDGYCRALPKGMIFVGREDCDLLLTSTTVDKRHAVIFYNTTSEQFHVKDLNSSYGTYVNDERVPDQCYMKLQHLDRIRFGFGPDIFIIHRMPPPMEENQSSSSPSSHSLSANQISNHKECVNGQHMKVQQSMNHQIGDESLEPVVDNTHSMSTPSTQSPPQFESSLPSPASVPPLEHAHTKTNISQTTKTPSPSVAHNKLSMMSSLNDNCENNSNSSLSTVDSLDDVPSSSRHRKVSDKILSPVKENPETLLSVCSAPAPVNKRDNGSLKSDIVNNNNLSSSVTSNHGSQSPAPVAQSESSHSQAMAFTIAFDDDDNNDDDTSNHKKKFNIKDSIRQFAPPKPDSIEKPRPKPRPSSVKTSSPSASSVKSESVKSVVSNKTKKSPTNMSRFNNSQKSVIRTKVVSGKECDTNGHLSDSATYLIQRMLYSEPAAVEPIKVPHNDCNNDRENNKNKNEITKVITSKSSTSKCSPVKEKTSPGERDSGVADDKSESGTYTVEIEQCDPDLEDARKKIDEVFGVYNLNMRLSPESLSPDDNEISPQTIAMMNAREFWLNQYQKLPSLNSQTPHRTFTQTSSPQTIRKLIPETDQLQNEISNNESVHQQQCNSGNSSTFTRSKRKFPVTPHHKTQSDTEMRNNSNQKSNTELLFASNNSGNKCNVNNASNTSQCQLYNNGNNNNELWMQQQHHHQQIKPETYNKTIQNQQSPLTARKLNIQSKEKPKLFHNERRKMSLTFSNSDVDSYNSDESTDPSIRSSNSAQSRNDGNLSSSSVPCSKMRFNKAFALRRARLGLETPGIPLNVKKNDNNNGKSKPSSGLQHKPVSANFVRSDGGRFSLRLNRSTDNRRGAINVPFKNRKDEISKIPVHRKMSDPSDKVNDKVNGRFTNSVSKNHTFSDNEHSRNVQSSSVKNARLQKSASFAESNGMDSGRHSESSVRNITPFQIGKRFFSTKPHQMAQIESSMRNKPQSPIKTEVMSLSMTIQSNRSPVSPLDSPPGKQSPQHQSHKSAREISALDSLVVSAINQLSQKLRTNLRTVLEKERTKHSIGSDARLMIEEILPQVSSPDRRLTDNNDNNISRDLSNILKNMKKVEQSLDVVSLLLDPNTRTTSLSSQNSNKNCRNTGYFVVDV